MSTHTATVEWSRGTEPFVDNKYSRAHVWRFDGGAVVPASSSPHVVRAPFSDPANVDPEEAYVAALSSCHMLWFLGIAASKGYRIDSYRDDAEGRMARGADGKQWVESVTLRPHAIFSGSQAPDDAAVEAMHHAAHAECFIANSVRSDVQIASSWTYNADV